MVVLQSMEDAGCNGDMDPGLSSSAAGMTMSGGKTSLIVMIPYVKNEGYTKEGGIGDQGQVVGTDVGFGQ